uniref:Uncharacterized protein n=1 Tax=Anguilla anguilla TaxID=7936 RepID=A0A0E9VIU8_ANGAN
MGPFLHNSLGFLCFYAIVLSHKQWDKDVCAALWELRFTHDSDTATAKKGMGA